MQPGKNMMAIIERAYQVFKRYPVPRNFDICGPCCVSPEEEWALYEVPLRKLSFAVLNIYNQSATSEEQDSNEIRYLLPRILELIAHGQYPGISDELSLRRVGGASPTSWLPAEYDLLTQFARQHVIDLLNEAEDHARLAELEAILIMFHLAGLDVTPLLDTVLDQPGFWAIASLAFMLIMERKDGRLCNAFSSNRDEQVLNQRINDWIDCSRQKLSEHAAAAIVSPADLSQHYEQYCDGMTLGFWIDDSLTALQDSNRPI